MSALVSKAGLILGYYTITYLPTYLMIDITITTYTHIHIAFVNTSKIIYYLISIMICYINAFKNFKIEFKIHHVLLELYLYLATYIYIYTYMYTILYYIDRFQVYVL